MKKNVLSIVLALLLSASCALGEESIELKQKVIVNGKTTESYEREEEISFSDCEEYSSIEGVTTFRGSNYRQNAGYGTICDDPTMLTAVWSVSVGGYEKWTGVGWTGQASIVQWGDEVRQIMNLYSDKKEKSNLREVIYGALDGQIHFLDLEDGSETRDSISIGAPIKGSVTVDPRGYPIVYCGQGIQVVNGSKKEIGYRAFSLIDGSTLMFINGVDKNAPRGWYAFDGACLVDAQTDTLLEVGENGVFYSVKLNTQFDLVNGTIALEPSVDRYVWTSKELKRLGTENSIVVYDHYGYFADNAGLLQCVDLNTLECVWNYQTGDDTDATCALEETEEGVFLYTGNEIENRGSRGNSNLRKFDALTGELIWQHDVPVSNSTYGGLFASPTIGSNALNNLVFFNVSCTSENGTLLALDKTTGETVWTLELKNYSWSTPLALYTQEGKGYIVVGDSGGKLRLIDGLTGNVINTLDLGRNIEGSPASYDDMIVVGTRGGRIYGVKVS